VHCEVRFFGGIASVAGVGETVRVDFGGGTLGDLLGTIASRWPGTAAYISGPRRGSVMVTLNGRALHRPEASLVLEEGDTITFLPFIGGG
jgi:molybdopterin converting factor small subunit